MQWRQLGKTGVQVSAVGLGGSNFGRYCDEAQSIAILRHALDMGINFLDTADVYGDGLSEQWLGKALAGHRHEVVLATKVGMAPLNPNKPRRPNDQGLSRSYINASLEASLRRLNTDHVDLYYAHQPDPTTSLEETLRAFDDLVRAGKVRYVACSNYPAWQVAHAQGICERRGYAPLAVAQNPYNLLERGIEEELIPCCHTLGLGLVPYVPLAGGMLTGKYRRAQPMPPGVRGQDHPRLQGLLTEANYGRVERLERFAAARDRTTAELALAWLLAQSIVSSILIGVTNPAQLDYNVKALQWQLGSRELQELDALLSE